MALVAASLERDTCRLRDEFMARGANALKIDMIHSNGSRLALPIDNCIVQVVVVRDGPPTSPARSGTERHEGRTRGVWSRNKTVHMVAELPSGFKHAVV